MLKKLKVRRGCTVPSQLTWPSTKKSDGTEKFVMIGSVDGCSVLSETQFVGTQLHVDTTWVLFAVVPFPLWELPARGQSLTSNRLWGSTPDFSSSLYPKALSIRGYICNTAGFEIRVFSLLGDLSKAIEPHMPVCHLYRWQLRPTKWSSPTAKSLDSIVITAIRVGFQGESLGFDTGGFACNCPVPEAWTTEASGLLDINSMQNTHFVVLTFLIGLLPSLRGSDLAYLLLFLSQYHILVA